MNYKALRRIRHNEKTYLPGEEIFLSQEEAASLIDSKAIDPKNPTPQRVSQLPSLESLARCLSCRSVNTKQIGGVIRTSAKGRRQIKVICQDCNKKFLQWIEPES